MSSSLLAPPQSVVSSGAGVAPAPAAGHVRRSGSGDIAISVQDLAKSYTIRHQDSENTLAQAMVQRLKNPLRRARTETFWALNGVSFDVARGEVLGLIGRNGAGKSTLLKLLARITEPTRGRAVLRGRVGSLLEVGTGFHPELTGRENVYLNGTILGMTRREITRQFDAIVDFSGTEKFLDTPVKRYSSGMYVRLAFAVAAHLNPEILIVDEVLAVGDGDFQKKCLGKMKDVAGAGRTVLFVSHAMNSVLQLCTRCIYLKNGLIQEDGPAAQVVDTYINEGAERVSERKWTPSDAPGNDEARLLAVRTCNAQGGMTSDFNLSTPIVLEMEFAVLKPGVEIAPIFHVFDSHNVCMFTNPNTENRAWFERKYAPGVYRTRCTIPANLFNDGPYRVSAILLRDYTVVLARVEDVMQFELHDDGAGRGNYTGNMMGVLRPLLRWDFEQVAELSPEGEAVQ
jgi:lipopolysaccharide transport system ATP-binding protein